MKIKFMTFNIQHCRDYVKRVIDVDLMVRTIQESNAEIIGLNEVYGKNEEFPCQAEEIARKLGYFYYFGPAIIHKGRPYGNALLSKYPIKSSESIIIPDPVRLEDNPYETRCIIKAEFDYPQVTVLATHFGLVESEQTSAVNTIVNLLQNINTPIVFLGDLNMEPSDRKLQPIHSLLKNTLMDNSLSYPSINPIKKIDYIFVSKNLEVVEAEILNVVASDHLPHIATIQFN